MALWQFTFDLIPSSAFALDGAVGTRAKLDRHDAVAFDFDELRTQCLLDRIGTILPEKQEVTTGLRVWGDYEGDDVQAGFDPARVLEYVQCRLDTRNLSRSLMNRLCSLASDFEFVLIDEVGVVLRPIVDDLVARIAQSDAVRYVNDSKNYFHAGSKYR